LNILNAQGYLSSAYSKLESIESQMEIKKPKEVKEDGK